MQNLLGEPLANGLSACLLDTCTAFLKERINLKALKLLESCSRLACHGDALVFLFCRCPVTPLPERSRNTLLRYYAVAGG